jgi:GTP cyclohydrolase I
MAHPVVMSKSKTGAVLDTDVLKDVRTEELYRELLRRIGEDPGRDGLLRTPERVEKSMAYLTKGYQEDPLQLLRAALFDVDYD